MLGKQKKMLLELLIEKYLDAEDADNSRGSVSSYELPPKKWVIAPRGDAMSAAISSLPSVVSVSVQYTEDHFWMNVSVLGGHPQDIAETIAYLRSAGVALSSGNYTVGVTTCCGVQEVSFNYQKR